LRRHTAAYDAHSFFHAPPFWPAGSTSCSSFSHFCWFFLGLLFLSFFLGWFFRFFVFFFGFFFFGEFFSFFLRRKKTSGAPSSSRTLPVYSPFPLMFISFSEQRGGNLSSPLGTGLPRSQIVDIPPLLLVSEISLCDLIGLFSFFWLRPLSSRSANRFPFVGLLRFTKPVDDESGSSPFLPLDFFFFF